MNVVSVVIAAGVTIPVAHAAVVLAGACLTGLGCTVFSALLLHAIAYRDAVLSSLGNRPVSYMTPAEGWAYGRWRAGGMQEMDSLLALPIWAAVLSHTRSVLRRLASAPIVRGVG